jgi:hypothetical protein
MRDRNSNLIGKASQLRDLCELSTASVAGPFFFQPVIARQVAVKAKARRSRAGILAGEETNREICEAFLGPRGRSPQA